MSTGKYSPGSFKQDIEGLLKYCREELKLTGKLGVYGRSLGGVPTNFVSDKCDMIIVDRTFSSLDSIATWIGGSKLASYGL